MSNKVMLAILDGWGLSGGEVGNSPLLAKTPTMDYVYTNYPKISLTASGLEVGLSPGEPGNSEVGHMNIGSGRVAWENLPRIDLAIESGEFAEKEALKAVIGVTKKNNSALHLVGLVSDGGVHSHIRHLLAFLEAASKANIDKVYVHFISDGRDTAPEAAKKFVDQLEEAFKKYGRGTVATLIGRYFAMDRDKNWDREKKAFDLFTKNVGAKYESITAAIEANYKNGKNDENIEPSVIGAGGVVAENDTVIFFNHRSDRSRQILSLFSGAEGAEVPAGLTLLSMTQYQKDQKAVIIFPPENLENTLSEIIARNNMRQFHTAETEKYAHVTYFFKCGIEAALKGETDVVVPSKKSPTYDKIPEMSAPEVTEKLLGAIREDYEFVVVNFANGDMVGHTGVAEAGVKACEAVDACLAQILPLASEHSYKTFITADHGNCDMMVDEVTKQPHKEHTTNPVPLVYLDFVKKPYQFVATEFPTADYIQYATRTPIGVLADLAPSILANLELEKSAEMDGMDLTATMI